MKMNTEQIKIPRSLMRTVQMANSQFDLVVLLVRLCFVYSDRSTHVLLNISKKIEGSLNKISDYFQDSLFATQRSNANQPNYNTILALPTQMKDIPVKKEKCENCPSYRNTK